MLAKKLKLLRNLEGTTKNKKGNNFQPCQHFENAKIFTEAFLRLKRKSRNEGDVSLKGWMRVFLISSRSSNLEFCWQKITVFYWLSILSVWLHDDKLIKFYDVVSSRFLYKPTSASINGFLLSVNIHTSIKHTQY